MNKINYEKESLEKLKVSLKRVFKETQEYGYPHLLDICDAEVALTWFVTTYGDRFVETKLEVVDQQIQILNSFDWNTKENLKSSFIIAMVKKQPEMISVLLKLKRQLVIPDMLNPQEENVVKKLIEQNLIIDLKIKIRNIQHTYYMLSAKGRAIFEDEELYKQFKLNFPNSVVPDWMNKNCQMNTQKIIQATIFNIYFNILSCQKYITFCFDENNDLLFASEITDKSVIKYYCFLGLMDEKYVEYLHYINKIIENDSIGCIEIICIDCDMKSKIESIISTKGFDLSKLKIQLLEAKHE